MNVKKEMLLFITNAVGVSGIYIPQFRGATINSSLHISNQHQQPV